MQYVIRTRSGGRHPFLVVRDVDSQIMGSYKTDGEAKTAVTQFQQMRPTWEALKVKWNRSPPALTETLDRPQYFPRSGFTKALASFVENAYGITGGDDPSVRLQFMCQIAEHWADSVVFRVFRKADMSEAIGIRRSSEKIGEYTANRLACETDPVKRAAFEVVQTVAAVAVDSLQDFPHTLGNPFAHEGVISSLSGLVDAIRVAQGTSDTSGPPNVRKTLRDMLPG